MTIEKDTWMIARHGAAILQVDKVENDRVVATFLGATKPVRVQAATLAGDFAVYTPCRWTLECERQATTTVLSLHYGDVDACADHAADHEEWRAREAADAAAGRVTYPPRLEPEPACRRPTIPRRKAHYCPTHGRLPYRGIDLIKFPNPPTTTLENTK